MHRDKIHIFTLSQIESAPNLNPLTLTLNSNPNPLNLNPNPNLQTLTPNPNHILLVWDKVEIDFVFCNTQIYWDSENIGLHTERHNTRNIH